MTSKTGKKQSGITWQTLVTRGNKGLYLVADASGRKVGNSAFKISGYKTAFNKYPDSRYYPQVHLFAPRSGAEALKRSLQINSSWFNESYGAEDVENPTFKALVNQASKTKKTTVSKGSRTTKYELEDLAGLLEDLKEGRFAVVKGAAKSKSKKEGKSTSPRKGRSVPIKDRLAGLQSGFALDVTDYLSNKKVTRVAIPKSGKGRSKVYLPDVGFMIQIDASKAGALDAAMADAGISTAKQNKARAQFNDATGRGASPRRSPAKSPSRSPSKSPVRSPSRKPTSRPASRQASSSRRPASGFQELEGE